MPEPIGIPEYTSELDIVREGQSGPTLHEKELKQKVEDVQVKRSENRGLRGIHAPRLSERRKQTHQTANSVQVR